VQLTAINPNRFALTPLDLLQKSSRHRATADIGQINTD
jgi:hypothetical protein